VVAVMDSTGKLVMESILETEAATILQFFAGLRGNLSVTFEEGTWSAWLYDLLNPHVEKLVVCNPRKNALLKDGNKNDRIDARKLAELLRGNQLKPVYHGENGVRMLRELSRSYLTIVKDLSRGMNRLKAVYRSWAIPCAGRDVYYRRHRAQWLDKIREAGVRRRLVVLALQDRLAYGPTFESALASLFGGLVSSMSAVSAPAESDRKTSASVSKPRPEADFNALIAEAAKDLAEYQRLTAEGKLGDAGQKLEELKQVLDKLNTRPK
jgi:hypothetical protein